MESSRKLLSLTLLITGACSQVPIEAGPGPIQVLLRARVGGTTGERYAGPMVFADADSLVMTDMRQGQRVTVRSGPQVVLEVYRGQKTSSDAIVKSAARNALFGGLVGAAAVLVGVGTSVALGGGSGGLGLDEWLRVGAVPGVMSGVVGGAVQGAKEGEPVWETVTVLQLRQMLCKCPNPDPPRLEPAVRLIPEG